jgi:hypothetical protein
MEDKVFREKSENLFSMSDFITPAPDVEYQMTSSDYKYRGLTESLLTLGEEDELAGVVSASEWRQFLTQEQEKVMARLKQEQAIMDKVVRLQQQRLHHEKEEAQILLLQNVAERDLEIEQNRERTEAKVRMEEREARDRMLQVGSRCKLFGNKKWKPVVQLSMCRKTLQDRLVGYRDNRISYLLGRLFKN